MYHVRMGNREETHRAPWIRRNGTHLQPGAKLVLIRGANNWCQRIWPTSQKQREEKKPRLEQIQKAARPVAHKSRNRGHHYRKEMDACIWMNNNYIYIYIYNSKGECLFIKGYVSV